MQKAIPFIYFDQPDHLSISWEAQDYLLSLSDNTLGVISVVGKYWTGKSFFINSVLINDLDNIETEIEGFEVGPTVNPCTKGIWMWSKKIHIKNQNHDKEFEVLILDCEGFGGTDQETSHNSKIYLMALLLSSFMIYNCLGKIEEQQLI